MRKGPLFVALLALAAGTPQAAPVGRAPVALTLDRAFLVGFWTDDNDCGNVLEIIRDGRFVAAGGGTGLWNLDGDRLTLTGETTATVRIVPIDQDTITIVHQDGSLGRSTRCAGPSPAPKTDDTPVRNDQS